MPAAAFDFLRQKVLKSFKIIFAHIAQAFYFRQFFAQNLDARFAFPAAQIIFARREVVFDARIADGNYRVTDSERNLLGFKQTAIEQQSVIFPAQNGRELIHNARPNADEFVFGSLRGKRQFFCGRLRFR